ncbi:MAG: hypothetical protein KY395_00375 [Actinobacteria bacterium]|nr:hypothetical protein [Actinomycetota bacterium]
MKRFSVRALAAAVFVTGLTLTAQPAHAHTESCSGAGFMGTNLVYSVGFGPSATGAVTFSFSAGGCVSGGSMISGAFTANAVGNYCEHSTGELSFGPDTLSWVHVGKVMILSGSHGGGVLIVEPNSSGGRDCVTGATQFLVSGSISTV